MTGAEYCRIFSRSAEKAYQTLFDTYGDYIYAVVYSKLKNAASKEDIEECVSDILAELYFGKGENFPQNDDLKPFISVVAQRRAADRFRMPSRGKQFVSETGQQLSDFPSDTDIEKQTDTAELRNILLSEIKALGPPDSEILIHKFYFSRSSSEIGRLLSMNPSSVRTRCRRAMKRLETRLKEIGITL